MLISAYHKRTGRKVLISDAVLTNPVLGGFFSKTPRQKAADRKAKAKSAEAQTVDAAPTAAEKEE